MSDWNSCLVVDCSGGLVTDDQVIEVPAANVPIGLNMPAGVSVEEKECSNSAKDGTPSGSPCGNMVSVEIRQESLLVDNDDSHIIDVDTIDMDSNDTPNAELSPSTRTQPCESARTAEHSPVNHARDNTGEQVLTKKISDQERETLSPIIPSPPEMIPIPLRLRENHNPIPAVRLTNFSIAEILKPEFGPINRDSKPWRPLSHSCDSPFTSTAVKSLGGSKGRSDSLIENSVKEEKCDFREEKVSSRRPSGGSSPGSPLPPAGDNLPQPMIWPAWVYCTRYSDRPSSGRHWPRTRKLKQKERTPEEKRPRTAFSNDQLKKLREEFEENRYLTEERRQRLARELDLNESQIKIWFQNKRAKMKKASGVKNTLALQLMAQGLYQHSTCLTTDNN